MTHEFGDSRFSNVLKKFHKIRYIFWLDLNISFMKYEILFYQLIFEITNANFWNDLQKINKVDFEAHFYCMS